MLIEHRGKHPTVHADAYVAPTAMLVGDVTVDAGARVLHLAVLSAEDGSVSVGENSVIMEHALVRGRRDHPAIVGAAVMVGPHTHVNGSVVEDEAFIATGASLFPGSRVGTGAEVRVHGTVQVNSRVGPGEIVPIGWVAVGNPARILPPERHDEIWAAQRELDFPGTVYGVGPKVPVREIMRLQSSYYGEHRGDKEL